MVGLGWVGLGWMVAFNSIQIYEILAVHLWRKNSENETLTRLMGMNQYS